MVQPEEVVVGMHAVAGIGAGAERVGLERGPLRPLVAVQTPAVVVPEHREAVGEGDLPLRRERQAATADEMWVVEGSPR